MSRVALRVFVSFVAMAAVGPFLAPSSAQRVSRTYYEDVHNGYRFRPPDDWANIPSKPDDLDRGIVCKMEGDTKIINVSGNTFGAKPNLKVVVVPDRDDSGERFDIALALPALVPMIAFDPDDPDEDKEVKGAKKTIGRRRAWTVDNGLIELVVDTYVFSLDHADICFVFVTAEEHWKKWKRTFGLVAKSFEPIEIEELEYEANGTYNDVLSYHEQIVARTPGWRALPTPSQKFVIKTSSDDMQFVDDVIERLELSRELFERDFPPSQDFDAVSVVRICATEEEFHSYGGTRRGTGGWFNPLTTELVLFDYKNTNRNSTYAVMSHEAFHQYCHFLFDQSDAHRWFDEGHGDYYGGVEFKGKKARATKKMPAGFDRLPVAKDLVRSGQYAPLRKHLNSNHSEWQNQGPTNVSCYGQSWSIIYMLRQGMLGEVSRKIWRPEYAEIIPNYVSSLYEGFQVAFAELLAEREAEAKEEGIELHPEDREITRFDLDEERRQVIWDAAMEASWGQIDLDRFEEDWLVFVKKHL